MVKKGTGDPARRENTCDFSDLEEFAISPVPFKGRMSRTRASFGTKAKESLKSETRWRGDRPYEPPSPYSQIRMLPLDWLIERDHEVSKTARG